MAMELARRPEDTIIFSKSTIPISLPELPSARFQFSLWHDIQSTELKGDELKAPRVRQGPNDQHLYKSNENGKDEEESIHHGLTGKAKETNRNDLENWEKAELASFGYQELQNGYQKKNLYRILHRLKTVKHLNLAHNDICDISSYSFASCEYLNLNNNYIASFKCLPNLKMVSYLTLIDNGISNLNGLKSLRSAPLEELYLQGNPVTFTPQYRQKVFAVLPQLQVLDGVYKLKSDVQPMEEPADAPKSCVIS